MYAVDLFRDLQRWIGMSVIPTKLKKDSIVEALFEMRFDAEELPEIIVGRLMDCEIWQAYERNRLPISDIPAPIRQSDRELRYQALVELKSEGGRNVVKIGTNVLSFHILKLYPGWSSFEPTLGKVVEFLYDRVMGLKIRRLGLRYINAMTVSDHMISDVSELDLKISLDGELITDSFNIAYIVDDKGPCSATVRVVTPNMLEGNFPVDTSVFIDIDVSTNKKSKIQSKKDVLSWLDQAHRHEKECFFSLLPDELIKQLMES